MKEITRYVIVNNGEAHYHAFNSVESAKGSSHYCYNSIIVELVGKIPENKKPKLVAPAIYFNGTEWILTRTLYGNIEAAKKDHEGRRLMWPALQDSDGMYLVGGEPPDIVT